MGAGTRALCIVFMAVWAAVGARAQVHSHYDVVALRVEFQPDTTRFTTGDGTLDGLRWGSGLDPKVDPLPHDSGYFQAHLTFLEDYVRSVSGGRTTLNTYLAPDVVRVAHEMGTYSPVGMGADSDTERIKLVRLVEEAWSLANGPSQLDLSRLDPDRTFFVLFHAGVGRDVELLGTVLEKTPLDLPSLYFSESELLRLGVTGLAYSNLPVTNSAIVPRTESRLGYNSITQDSLLLELSINGLLASSFFSFLGVPDLFNTATGESAIGGFGLMDPQGIFAYAGMIPPAPTAWTRQRLGWLEPLQLQGPGPIQVTLPTGSAARASVSTAEYFLIENRQRDADGDGLVLRVWQDGHIVEQRVDAISDTFSRFNVDAFVGGVVVGADDYDFALPGRDADGMEYAGGILIWHVDERVIATGQVNANPDFRGLDLEEADAAQDLGHNNTPGSPFDFFFEGNDVRAVLPSGREIQFYENRFGPTTTPSSIANDGGESFITLTDFSAPGPAMTFTYQQKAAYGIRPEEDVSLGAAVGRGSSVGGGEGFTFVFQQGTPNRVTILMDDSSFSMVSHVRPVAVRNTITVLQEGDVAGGQALKTIGLPDQGITEVRPLPASLLEYVAQGPLIASEDGAIHVLLTNEAETALLTAHVGGAMETQKFPAGGMGLALAPDGTVLVIGRTYVARASGAMLWTFDEGGKAAFAESPDGLLGAMTVPAANAVRILATRHHAITIDVTAYVGEPATLSDYATLADLDADGAHEVVTTAGEHLLAFELGGAMAAGFPVRLGATLIGQPLVTSRTEGVALMLVASTNGLVYAVEGGRQVPGFPLSVGGSILATPRLSEGRLEVATSEGVLRTYSMADIGALLWGEQHYNSANTNFAAPATPATPPAGARLLVASETYNWPNPVRKGVTFLRLMTSEDAAVSVTIVDMAGTVVHESTFDVRSGSPAEYRWQAAIESGLYFARIRATSSDGRTDTRLVRIAVIR